MFLSSRLHEYQAESVVPELISKLSNELFLRIMNFFGWINCLVLNCIQFSSSSGPCDSCFITGGESGKATQRVRTGGGDRYRVLLLDAEHHTETFGRNFLPLSKFLSVLLAPVTIKSEGFGRQ